jgi:electron transport complex protein RnfD
MSEEAVKQETAGSLFTVSVSPHIRDDETISHIMWQVNAALLPAALFAA